MHGETSDLIQKQKAFTVDFKIQFDCISLDEYILMCKKIKLEKIINYTS